MIDLTSLLSIVFVSNMVDAVTCKVIVYIYKIKKRKEEKRTKNFQPRRPFIGYLPEHVAVHLSLLLFVSLLLLLHPVDESQ